MKHTYTSGGSIRKRVEVDRKGVFTRLYQIVDNLNDKVITINEKDWPKYQPFSDMIGEVFTHSIVETPVVREIRYSFRPRSAQGIDGRLAG